MKSIRLTSIIFTIVVGGLASADETNRLPEGLPGLAGTAVVSVSEEAGQDSAWTIAVSLEEETWEEVLSSPSIRERWKETIAALIEKGELKLEREVNGTGVHSVRRTRMMFQMNKPDHAALCRLFDISGKELSREELVEKLAEKAMVLVSFSGQMPHHQYLRLVESDTLVVLIVPDDKVAAPVAKVPRRHEDKAKTKNLDGKNRVTGDDYILAQQRLPRIELASAKEASDYMRGIWKMDENFLPPQREAEEGQIYVICTGDWLVIRRYMKRGGTVQDELNRIDGFEPNRAGRKHTQLIPETSGRHECNWEFWPIDQDHLHLGTYDTVIPLQRMIQAKAEPLDSAKGGQTAEGSARIAVSVLDEGHGGIYVLNADGSGKQRLTNGSRDILPQWSPDGKQIAFLALRVQDHELAAAHDLAGHFYLYAMDADGRNQRRVTETPIGSRFQWSSDGNQFLFQSSWEDSNHTGKDGLHSSAIYAMKSDGTQRQRLTPIEKSDSFPTWSPDGKRIAFSSDRRGNQDIYVMNADGSGVRRLTENEASDTEPVWSPDGSQLAFTSFQLHAGGSVCLVQSDGSDEKLICDKGRAVGWSPDSRRILITKDGQLAIVDTVDKQEIWLTQSGRQAQDAVFTSDGKKIFYRTKESDGWEIMSVSVNGAEPQRIIGDVGNIAGFCLWTPRAKDMTNDGTRNREPSDSEFSPEITAMLAHSGQSEAEFRNKLHTAISQAAGIPNAQWEKFATDPTGSPKAIEGIPLSYLLLVRPSGPAPESPDASEGFRVLKPRDLLFDAMAPSQEHGYVSLIQPEYIKHTMLDIDAESKLLRGTVRFEAPKLYAGEVNFAARYHAERLKVVEFMLPKYRLTIALDEEGVWRGRKLPAPRPTEAQSARSATGTRAPNPPVIAIDGSGTHSLFLLSDGTVWGSGWNYHGELGDGTILERHSPIPILSDVKDIAAGGFQSLFLRDDGSVWAAGANDSGQLGDGTNEERRITPVIIMADVADMAVGNFHCLFLKKDGTVWTSGRNSDGELGDGTTTSRNDPMQLMAEVAAIEAGQSHSLFLKKDGSVWAAGQNKYGQLGDGTTTAQSASVQIMTDVVAISAGLSHSLFLKQDGSVWAAGGNVHGQLGDGTQKTRSTPVRVAIEDVVAISAGCSHSLFLKSDGSVWATGRNVEGQLGDGTQSNRLKPVPAMTEVAAISAGRHYSMFLKRDGSVWCVGDNTRGQLGDGTTVNRATPVEVSFRNTPNPDIEFEKEFSQQFIIGGPLPENPRGAREAGTGTPPAASDLSKEELEQNRRGAALVDELFKEWSQSDKHLPMFLALSTIVADEGMRCSILDLSRDPHTGKQSPNVDVPLLLYAYHSSYVLPDGKNRPVHDRKAVLVLVNGKTGRPIDYVFGTGYRSEKYSGVAEETTEWTTEWEQQDGTQTRYRILASGFKKISGENE